MKYLITVLVVLGFVGIMYAANVRADNAEAAYTKYEDCVQKQYGMLPSTYYQLHGVTPECQ